MRRLETMATYICDCCGELLRDHDGMVGYVNDDIWSWSHEWIEHEGKHYCPDCYRIDDDDNIVIKSK